MSSIRTPNEGGLCRRAKKMHVMSVRDRDECFNRMNL